MENEKTLKEFDSFEKFCIHLFKFRRKLSEICPSTRL